MPHIDCKKSIRNFRKRSHFIYVTANCRANTIFLKYLIDGGKNPFECEFWQWNYGWNNIEPAKWFLSVCGLSLSCIWQPTHNWNFIETLQHTKIESTVTKIDDMEFICDGYGHTQNTTALIICRITSVGSINFMRFNVCIAYPSTLNSGAALCGSVRAHGNNTGNIKSLHIFYISMWLFE